MQTLYTAERAIASRHHGPRAGTRPACYALECQDGDTEHHYRAELKPLGLTQAELAATLGMPRVAVNAIINGKRSVTPGTAMRLAKALGTTPEFWINGQIAADLYKAEHDAVPSTSTTTATSPALGHPGCVKT